MIYPQMSKQKALGIFFRMLIIEVGLNIILVGLIIAYFLNKGYVLILLGISLIISATIVLQLIFKDNIISQIRFYQKDRL